MPTIPLTCDIHQAVADFAARGRPFALITVLEASGSTPREAGTRAVVDADGAIHGTVGGGQLEARACAIAAEAIRAGRPAILDQRFAGKDATEDRPVCGGTMRLLVDPTAASCAGAHARAAAARRERRRGVLVTVITRAGGGTGAGTAVRTRTTWCDADRSPGAGEDLPPGATIDRSLLADALARRSAVRRVLDEEAGAEVLADPVLPAPRLLVVGGGHVGQALAAAAAPVGFEIVVAEDRPEFADPARFPAGTRVLAGQTSAELAAFPTDRDTFIALVSRGHLVDGAALGACIRKPAAYLGMMGSRRKVALLREHFLRAGLATAEEFDRLRAPIGLEIGARTPAEIAVSIVAELIATRHGVK